MADGYGEVDTYGELIYKQDRGDLEDEHFRIMMAMWPVKQMLEDPDDE
jgi:hypothetical protein